MRKSRRNVIKFGMYTWLAPTLLRPIAGFAGVAPEKPRTLSTIEWKTVEAITGRIIPTDKAAGAIEAECVNFIDKMLADDDKTLLFYKSALAEIRRVCFSRYKQDLHNLDVPLQDTFVLDLQGGLGAEWKDDNVRPEAFFDAIWAHTIMGFLSDPKYGGNYDHIGWRVAGFPGHIHQLGGVSAEQMRGERKVRTAWGEEI